jgi:hypothetical protein
VRNEALGSAPTGLYEIVRLLPASGASVPYRVRGQHESHERVLDERALSDRFEVPEPPRKLA